jgi:ATP synthase protein I
MRRRVPIGLAGGYFLDRALGTSPWLFFLGFLVGFAAGVANLYRAATAPSDSSRSPKP